MSPERGDDGDGASPNRTLTAIEGVLVGHWTDGAGRTGCTVVVLPPEGAVASGSVLGAAPGTRETALLAPQKTVQRVHAFVLTGGSAFGLAAAHGVMLALEARGVGHSTPAGPVPIVPAAALFDLMVGAAHARPGAAEGALALGNAGSGPVRQGAVGVGTGATVGKVAGFEHATASGVGSALLHVRGALVGAVAVSNAVGDLVDPSDGRLVAGSGHGADPERAVALFDPTTGVNTTLVVVVTDAPISKAEARALADAAHVGIARVTRPSHTVADGDTAFVASTARGPVVDAAALGVAVQVVVAEAILGGARAGAAHHASAVTSAAGR
jgi:L-aminopeptidase/D-esterase-like protein